MVVQGIRYCSTFGNSFHRILNAVPFFYYNKVRQEKGDNPLRSLPGLISGLIQRNTEILCSFGLERLQRSLLSPSSSFFT